MKCFSFCSNEAAAVGEPDDPAELQRQERLRKQREKQLRFQQQQQQLLLKRKETGDKRNAFQVL